MGYIVTAVLKVIAKINVSAGDPREAEIEATSQNVLDWEILCEPVGVDNYEIIEVIESEPNGPDYEPDIMFTDALN